MQINIDYGNLGYVPTVENLVVEELQDFQKKLDETLNIRVDVSIKNLNRWQEVPLFTCELLLGCGGHQFYSQRAATNFHECLKDMLSDVQSQMLETSTVSLSA